MQGYLSFAQGNATGYEPKTMESIMFVVLVVLCALFVQNLVSRVRFSLHHSGSIAIITCFYLLFVGIVTNYQVMSIPCSFLANWFATVNQDKHVSHLTGYFQLMCDDSSRSNAYVLLLCNAIVYRFTYQLLLARTSSLGTCPDTNSTLGHFGYTLFHTLLGLQDQFWTNEKSQSSFSEFFFTFHQFVSQFSKLSVGVVVSSTLFKPSRRYSLLGNLCLRTNTCIYLLLPTSTP